MDDTDKKVCVKNDLESGKKYYVRICVSGIRNNSNWSIMVQLSRQKSEIFIMN